MIRYSHLLVIVLQTNPLQHLKVPKAPKSHGLPAGRQHLPPWQSWEEQQSQLAEHDLPFARQQRNPEAHLLVEQTVVPDPAPQHCPAPASHLPPSFWHRHLPCLQFLLQH
jgi:hypothetical protein